jgi:hypothetical protein
MSARRATTGLPLPIVAVKPVFAIGNLRKLEKSATVEVFARPPTGFPLMAARVSRTRLETHWSDEEGHTCKEYSSDPCATAMSSMYLLLGNQALDTGAVSAEPR